MAAVQAVSGNMCCCAADVASELSGVWQLSVRVAEDATDAADSVPLVPSSSGIAIIIAQYHVKK